jgi:hypothetical protein
MNLRRLAAEAVLLVSVELTVVALAVVEGGEEAGFTDFTSKTVGFAIAWQSALGRKGW